MSVEKLIQRVFASRDVAHVAHWQTKSFSQHSALGEFYDSVIGKLDEFVEVNQGGFGRIGDVPGIDAKDATKTLRDEFIWLNANRAAVCKDLPALENIYDEIVALYLRAIYKLENLE